MAEKRIFDDKSVAARRWRNLMIASMSGHNISTDRREYLEQMRRKLGISVDDARQIVDDYRHMGGGITLFGDKFQRLQIFRDIISMLLVDGELADKGRSLLLRIAKKLDLDEATLDNYINLAAEAMKSSEDGEDSHESQRLSRRVFRRMVSDSEDREQLLKSFDSLDRAKRRELELKVLEKFTGESADSDKIETKESVRSKRFKEAYLEDERCAVILIEKNVISEAQIKPFKERQKLLFETDGTVVSFLTEMVKAKVLSSSWVDQTREAVRKEYGELEVHKSWNKSVSSELGGLRLSFKEVTLDHTFWVSCIGLKGFLDHNSVDLLQNTYDKIFRERGDSSRMVIMDMGGLNYISSAGVGAILNARAKTLDRWGDIRFVNVSKEAQEIFSLIGVDHVFTFCETVEEALWSFTDIAVAKDPV